MNGILESIKRKLKWYPTLSVFLAILVTIFFILQPQNAVIKYGLSWGTVLREPWRLITCHFIHIGETHYLMNTLGIIIIGSLLEYGGLKRKHILLGIGFSILTTDLFALFVQIFRPSIVGGFSGVIYGFVGLMIVMVGWGGIIALGSLFFGIGILTLGSNIAWGAHLGGFIGGLIIGKMIKKREI